MLDATYFDLSGGDLTQDWSNASLITANDDWSGVPSIVGFLGQDITTATGADPRTLTGTSSVANDVDVIANQTNTTIATGGVAEFAITNPVVALQGSGTADVPYLQFHLNTTGRTAVRLQANLRDLDGSTDNATQPINVQYRVGTTGAWINVTGGYFADVTTANAATQVTILDVTLPALADNQAQVQVRVMTVNAAGNDEWVGIDDIVISSAPTGSNPTVSITPVAPDPRNTAVSSIAIVFSEPVANFSIDDLSLTRNGSPVNLSAATITTTDNTTFTLGNLIGLTNVDGAYSLTLAVADIVDASLNPLVSGANETWLLDGTAPTIASLLPVDGEPSVFPEDNLIVTFSEAVSKGTGNITVHQSSDGAVVETIDVTSSAVTVTGGIAIINPAVSLPASRGLYVNIPATAFIDATGNAFAGIASPTAWNFTTTAISSVIAQQNFNALTANTTVNTAVNSGELLPNTGSQNVGGADLDFQTRWFDTRNNQITGPIGGSDTTDFVGVSTFTGPNAPNVSASGVAVSNAEKNFQLNDADGQYVLAFEPVNVSGFNTRFLTFDYWISATDFEAGDLFRATITDGVNTLNFIDFGPTELNQVESVDNSTANWRTARLGLDNLISGLNWGPNLTLTISVSNTDDTGADGVFIDNVAFRGVADVIAPDIEVRGNSTVIVDGDTTPSVLDATIFGTLVQGSTAVTATYTIGNTGNGALNLAGAPVIVTVAGAPEFTVTTQPATATVGPGSTTTFVVTFTPTTLGVKTATISISSNDPDESPYTFDVSGTVTPPPPTIFINEIDADTLGSDTAEFIELYDGGVGNTSLSGLVVVFWNGAGDVSYAAFDLDGFTTDSNGYFVLGNAAVPGVDLVFANNSLQNGADAVGLYLGDAVAFPSNTPLTLLNLIDAVVYDTDDLDDTGLLSLVIAGGQVNESGGANAEGHSISRVPNGGTLRNSSNFVAQAPTPGTSNVLPALSTVRVNGADTFANANLSQRSQITSLEVVFTTPVIVAPGAFSLENIGLLTQSSSFIDPLQLLVSGSGTTWTIRFGTGPGVVTRDSSTGIGRGNSLADGNFVLTINPIFVTAVGSGAPLSTTNSFGDGDNQFGDLAADQFFRMFGDSDGDGDVDGRDTLAFRTARSTYNPALDWSGDGFVNNSDSSFFSTNNGRRRRLF